MATEPAGVLTFADLAIVLLVAAIALLIVRRLRQPLVLGYLVAGLLVGPNGPFPTVSPGSVTVLGELGIVFIMASLGLEFNPKKLRRLGGAPVAVALVQLLLGFLVGRYAAHLMGYDDLTALFIGAGLAISSTIVAVKILEERKELAQPHARLAIGVLLLQDIAAVAFLGVAQGISVTGTLGLGQATPVLAGLVVFAVAALVLGAVAMPRLLNEASRGSRELLLIVILGAVFGVSLLAEHLGFGVALGAFLVGAVIAETRVVHLAERMVDPLKHTFTAVFFVSIGMLIEPAQLVASWKVVALFSAIVITTRLVGVAVPAFLFGYPPRTAVRAGASLSQIGEFSFIVLGAGLIAGREFLPPNLLAIFVGVAGITTLTTPYMVMLTGPMLRAVSVVTPTPLKTYAEYYTGWVQRLGEAEETRRHRTTEVFLLRRIVLNVVALLSIGALGFLLAQVLGTQMMDLGALRFPAAWIVYAVVTVFAIPFLFTIWRAAREFVVELVLELVPDSVAKQTEAPVALRVVRASLGLVLGIAMAGVALALMPVTGEARLAFLIAVTILVLVPGILFYRNIQNLHSHVEGTIENLFGVQKTSAERDEVLRLIGRHYTVSLETETVTVPERSPVGHHQIRDAQIRNRTGATIVSLERGHERYVNPPPNMLILPGDQILLMGETHHLRKAKALIMRVREMAAREAEAERTSRREPVQVREVVLPQDALARGKSIAELELRAITGASLVAAIRDHDHIQNPTPNFTLHSGDRLFLLGTGSQLDTAEALLRQELPDLDLPPEQELEFERDEPPEERSSRA